MYFGITNIDGGLVFEQVCLDLETEGYEVQPFIIPAAAKNAPHRRDRCWFIAFKNTLHGGCLHGEHEQERAKVRKFGNRAQEFRRDLFNKAMRGMLPTPTATDWNTGKTHQLQ
jgi:site-specific DNA-cytosine methylase